MTKKVQHNKIWNGMIQKTGPITVPMVWIKFQIFTHISRYHCMHAILNQMLPYANGKACVHLFQQTIMAWKQDICGSKSFNTKGEGMKICLPAELIMSLSGPNSTVDRAFSLLSVKACVCYILASLFVNLKEGTCGTMKNVYFTSKALFVLQKTKFQIFRFKFYSNFMTSSNAQA